MRSTTWGRPATSATKSPESAAAARRWSTDAGDGATGDGDEPRQVHRLPHLLGDVQAGLDQPHRRRVRVVQQCRDPTGTRLPAHLPGPGTLAGWLDAEPSRPAHVARRRPGEEAAQHLFQPADAIDPRLLRAVDVRLREPHDRTGATAHPGRPSEVAADRQEYEGSLVGELGRRSGWRTGADQRRPRTEEGQRQDQTGLRADLHVLPPADLRTLPQPGMRGVVPVRGDLQEG